VYWGVEEFDVGLAVEKFEHMNGRLFDPYTGRFLSADPYVQSPDNLQSYDRYGYCWNSPMMCTDPSGYIFGIGRALKKAWKQIRPFVGIIAAIALGPGGMFGATGFLGSAFASTVGAGFIAGGIATGSLNGALMGAATAALFYGAGQLANGMKLSNASLGRALIHAGAGCINGAASGGSCGRGALSAGLTKFASSNIEISGDYSQAARRAIETTKYAVIGGTVDELTGGKFANGAVTGAFQYLANAAVSEINAMRVGLVSAARYAPRLCASGAGCVVGLAVSGAAMGCYASDGCSDAAADMYSTAEEKLAAARKALNGLMDKAAAESKTGRQEYVYTLRAEQDGYYPNLRTGGQDYLNRGEIYKIGTSYDTAGRYSDPELQRWGGVAMKVETPAISHYEALVIEKSWLIGYSLSEGQLPPGNLRYK
jgi:RHS repeat-associated protein